MKVQEYTEIKGVRIPVHIINHNKSGHVRLTMKEGYLSVYKPAFYSMYQIHKLITKHENEIYMAYTKVLQEIEKKKEAKRQWVTGDRILYHGEYYQLVRKMVPVEKERLEITDHKILCYLLDQRTEEDKVAVVKALLKHHLTEETKALLSRRLPMWSEKMGLAYDIVKVRYAKTRWGSCVASKRSLNFNALLAMFPEPVADAVMVHELAHLKEANHGKAFWDLVYHYIPEYDDYHQWLKQHREELKVE